jgi:peptidylprolyl isomerase
MTDKTKPEIEFLDGPAPTDLAHTDLEVGYGAEASPGGRVEVHYLGADFESGEEFGIAGSRSSFHSAD